ncbi:hypothetical protein B9Q04_00320 [Candidatus Marsarchaeota G2 archaeon BE_D]|uniref:Uncharacterized protein n=4 Tax=Candidatus Marsarchaeota group 2 TaxID=2203771 RepID=A0A2R6CF05_9ARCH|nr:MAG: hypothetical protein B9Q06_00700 [Candidatus Marsarchaeota G2 archaeon ECH_B_2]PSO01266.1 MAG: hypothetical protein B9Q07_00105 [Candidatus Marsarchaeota G2 archaeon ECH_B_3]PSO03400.1 MAG: hypothetical protein B9Q05_00700 [Candidatus Marsarchaeota G2 archaeon ECH_B_1]PSO09468.1 MAG: hypothetical protein B9Q04_00320 [Candidatus Marsarchaeota G2 archaeon BE_D]
MDDAFDALLATTIFLVITAYALQVTITQHQPQPTLNGYEEQIAQQIMAAVNHNPKWEKTLAAQPQLEYTPNTTLIKLNNATITLQPPTQITGQIDLCVIDLNTTQWCINTIIGGNPEYDSCYTAYTFTPNQTLLEVTSCLG